MRGEVNVSTLMNKLLRAMDVLVIDYMSRGEKDFYHFEDQTKSVHGLLEGQIWLRCIDVHLVIFIGPQELRLNAKRKESGPKHGLPLLDRSKLLGSYAKEPYATLTKLIWTSRI